MLCIDNKTGEIYNGSKPYIHWFQQEMGVGLIYTHLILVISEYDELEVYLDSDVFHILNIQKGKLYNDIKCDHYISKDCERVGSKYIHPIYFSASSPVADQFTTDVSIDGEIITLGADFYDENESLYVNLSNMGVELPHAIQKSIYPHNIKEDKTDHILLNRKMKELLSNYWDVIANKGSYKSLINSLKWFEWGNLIQLKEIWRHEDFGRNVYDDRSICSVIEEKYNDSVKGFAKTTHMALYVAMHDILNELDDEGNPKLKEIVSKWSKNDLAIKLSLLGNFYETYFMPIHLNLFETTIENVVFTNTVKLINNSHCTRTDYVYNIHEFDCNIKDNQSFALSNIQCYVNPHTFFRNPYKEGTDYNDIIIVGVDKEIKKGYRKSETHIDEKTFFSQFYGGSGCIVDFECMCNDDIIESICYIHNIKVVDFTEFSDKINFSILFKQVGKYSLSFQFTSKSGKIYSKSLSINIVDVNGMGIKLYKIQHIAPKLTDLDQLNEYKGINVSKNKTGNLIKQYIPVRQNQYSNGGICLNHILILEGNYEGEYEISSNYFTYKKDVILDNGNEKQYTMCISKGFWFSPELSIPDFKSTYKEKIKRSEYGFFPAFHELKEFGGNDINDYIIQNEALVVVPELPYGLEIDDWDWEFVNVSTNTSHKLDKLQTPIIAGSSPLTPGYYDIIFKYKLGKITHELKLDSAFIQA